MVDPMTPPRESRNPDTIFLAALILVSGLGILLSGVQPASVDTIVPAWLANTWASILTVGAGTTLAGTLWHDELGGLAIELVGRVMLGPAALGYAFAIITAVGVSGGLPAGICIGLGCSSAWRARLIFKKLRGMRATVDDLTHRQEGTT